MRVTVDSQRCAASGACVRVDPTVFELAVGGKAVLRQSDLPEEQRSTMLLAAELCPTGAISVD
jgi:ferredoxin